MDHLRPALDLQRELDQPRLLALTLINLGTALVTVKSEPEFAVEMLESALGITEGLGDLRSQLAARQRLAMALGQSGRLEDALATAKVQHAEVVRTGYLDMEADAILAIGDLYLATGDVASARASYETLMQLVHDRSDQAAERKAISALTDLALHEMDKATAARLLEQRLLLAVSLRDKAVVGVKLGELLATEGNFHRATVLLQQALEYFVSIDHETVGALRDRIRVLDDAKPVS